jgi:hypothetical protein
MNTVGGHCRRYREAGGPFARSLSKSCHFARLEHFGLHGVVALVTLVMNVRMTFKDAVPLERLGQFLLMTGIPPFGSSITG